MGKYEQAQEAWREVHSIMKEIDSDYWIGTGQHLEMEVARDLAIAYILAIHNGDKK